MSDLPAAPAIRAVLLDFNHTVAAIQDVPGWLAAARARLGRQQPGAQADDPHVAFLAELWAHAATLDPRSERDLSAQAHRRITLETMTRLGGLDAPMAGVLYDLLPAQWQLFDEVPGVLRALREHGIRLGLLSNIGLDIRACLATGGVLDLFDAVVLSFEVGLTKPDPAIFRYAVQTLDIAPAATLMVGDSGCDDSGGAELGIRTLILPPTTGPRHGLEAVLALAGVG